MAVYEKADPSDLVFNPNRLEMVTSGCVVMEATVNDRSYIMYKLDDLNFENAFPEAVQEIFDNNATVLILDNVQTGGVVIVVNQKLADQDNEFLRILFISATTVEEVIRSNHKYGFDNDNIKNRVDLVVSRVTGDALYKQFNEKMGQLGCYLIYHNEWIRF